MAEFFKDYGSAVGPTLAFCLGILALFVKYSIDRYLLKKKSKSELNKLYELIRESSPPKTFYPERSDIAPTVDQLRNKKNVIAFKRRLDGISPLIDHLNNNIYEHGNLNDIRIFNNLKTRFYYLLNYVKEVLDKKNVIFPDIELFKKHYDGLLETFEEPNKIYEYIEVTEQVASEDANK